MIIIKYVDFQWWLYRDILDYCYSWESSILFCSRVEIGNACNIKRPVAMGPGITYYKTVWVIEEKHNIW